MSRRPPETTKGPPRPLGSGNDGPFGNLCRCPAEGQPAAGAELAAGVDELDEDDDEEVDVDEDADEDEPEPTELLEEERLSVR
ncbi:hypothetical protein GCM10009639_53190 [Kitasatospora putterlickiae]|uniref:Uncharacterized protein n=1 Tax=Kitasatospora putterlickiae TaxID=221725 RepID=A0ABN1YDJ3_9ACTN